MKNQSNYLWLIDAGHGGINSKGEYVTAPSKMHKFSDGYTIYEGFVNRQIAKILYTQLMAKGIDFGLVYDEVKDTSLTTRVNIVNQVYSKDKRAILLDIHSNAGGGKGCEVWTSIGQTKSDIIAETLCKKYQEGFKTFPFRADKASDGDLDKESKFTMVTRTNCPAVLVENFFMDNRREAEFLNSPAGQVRIASILLSWILEIEATKPI